MICEAEAEQDLSVRTVILEFLLSGSFWHLSPYLFLFFSLNGCNLCFYAISSGAIVHSSMLCAAIIDQLDLWDHFFMWMARAILHSSM